MKPFPQLSERGIPLLRAVWEQIKQNPSTWDQRMWIAGPDELPDDVVTYIEDNRVPPWNCGTTACIAGHAALATGATIPNVDLLLNSVSVETILTPEGEEVEVDEYAMNLFGISEGQAFVLFNGSGTAEMIERYVCALEEDANADLYQIYAAIKS